MMIPPTPIPLDTDRLFKRIQVPPGIRKWVLNVGETLIKADKDEHDIDETCFIFIVDLIADEVIDPDDTKNRPHLYLFEDDTHFALFFSHTDENLEVVVP